MLISVKIKYFADFLLWLGENVNRSKKNQYVLKFFV